MTLNVSIPKTFINNVIDNEPGKDEKDKRVRIKYLAFIGQVVLVCRIATVA